MIELRPSLRVSSQLRATCEPLHFVTLRVPPPVHPGTMPRRADGRREEETHIEKQRGQQRWFGRSLVANGTGAAVGAVAAADTAGGDGGGAAAGAAGGVVGSRADGAADGAAAGTEEAEEG